MPPDSLWNAALEGVINSQDLQATDANVSLDNALVIFVNIFELFTQVFVFLLWQRGCDFCCSVCHVMCVD